MVSFVAPPSVARVALRKREQSMGVSVKLTSSDTIMANAAV